MKNQNRKIPKIRFNKFDSIWEEDRIADIVKISAGGDVDKVKLKESGKYPVIANALTNKGIVGFYDDYKVKAPAVTVTGRGDVGYAVARHENFTPVVRLLTLQSENIDVDYLENQINSMRILNESTGVPQLTAPQLGNYKVYHPEIEEQSAIGSIFRTIDDLLASYKDNLANYQSLKVTMLSKMFPKVGQTVPEIRLDGFEGEWEIVKLGDNCRIITGGTPRTGVKEFWNPKEIPWMSSGEINKKILNKTEEMISHIGLQNSSAKWVKQNSVLIALAGQGQTRGRVAINKIPLTTNQSIAAIETNSCIDFLFLYTDLERRYDELRLISSGDGTRGGLNKTIISSLELNLPAIDEQQAIGRYFSNLDNLINSYQEKITQLETLKKKLLQDMFI